PARRRQDQPRLRGSRGPRSEGRPKRCGHRQPSAYNERKRMTANTRTGGKTRVEEDALGDVEVPAGRLWGAQTQRSHLNFPIGVDRYRWGRTVISALRHVL